MNQVSIFLKTGKVNPEWTDYNGHMNLAYYIHLFDVGWEVILERLDIGEKSAKNQKKTTFAVESHTTYDQEVRSGDELDINLLFLDNDNKRLIYKLEMINKKDQYIAATTEVCSLYIDLENRKVVNFETHKKKNIKNFIDHNYKNFNPGELRLIKKLKK